MQDKMPPIILAGQQFPSWSKAKEHAMGILHRYPPGQIISPEDSDFIWDALSIRGIIKNNLYKIIVDYNGFGSVGFEFLYPDGTKVPFSYRKCFEGHSGRGKITPQQKRFLAACRTAIAIDHPTNTGLHYHHDGISFKNIIKEFLEESCINVSKVKFRSLDRGGVAFADIDLENYFRRYHQAHARFIPVTKEEHKAIHKKLRSE